MLKNKMSRFERVHKEAAPEVANAAGLSVRHSIPSLFVFESLSETNSGWPCAVGGRENDGDQRSQIGMKISRTRPRRSRDWRALPHAPHAARRSRAAVRGGVLSAGGCPRPYGLTK